MSESHASFLETWGVLIIMGLASLIVVLDTPMMMMAISAVVADLNTTVQGVQAAIALSAMVIAAFTLAGSQLGAAFGMKWIFTIGLIGYGIGTLTAALTPNIELLALGWSLIKGMGAALILPMVLTVLMRHYKGQRLALSLGVVAGVQVVGVAIGPLFGGFLASQFSWRWAFGSETLIVVVMLALVSLLPQSEPQPEVRIDWLGMLLLATGLIFIIFGGVLASNYGWLWAKQPFGVGNWEVTPFGLSIVPFLMALGCVSLVVWGLWQRQQMQVGHPPLVRLDWLHNRSLLAEITVIGLLHLMLTGILFTMPVFLQGGLGLSPLKSAMILLPLLISVLLIALTSSSLGQWVEPKYIMMFGLAIMLSGLAVLHQALVTPPQGEELLAGLLVLGSGLGLVWAQVTQTTLARMRQDAIGAVLDLNHTVKHIGTGLGAAIVGSLLISALLRGIVTGVDQQQTLDWQTRQTTIVALQAAAQDLSPAQKTAFLSRLSAQEQTRLTAAVTHSWTHAMQIVLLATIGLTLLCLVAVFFL